MKIILKVALLQTFLFWTTQAQTTLFNKLYYTDTTSMLSVAAKPKQNGYFVVGGYNSPLSHSSFYVRNINSEGESIWFKSINYGIHSLHTFFGNSFISTNDNCYMLTGQRGVEDTLDNFWVAKINILGNVLWSRSYGLPNSFDSNTQITATNDGGYLLSGWTALYNESTGALNYSQIYMVRIDNEGNQLWSKKIGSNAEPLHCEETQDGGFIISGYRYSSATGYDMYVVKTDSLGNLQWQQTYGSPLNDNGCFVKQLSNGNYILLGAISPITELQDYYYISELNEYGEEVWHVEHEINQYCGNNAQPYLEIENNAIVAILYHYSSTTTRINEFCRFSVLDGSILCRTPISSGFPGEDYIRDIEPTSDGGYLLVGFNYTSPAKSWVLKVDSLGQSCGVAPCDSIIYAVSTPPLHNPLSTYATLYPNPAKGSTTISYSLPPQLPFAVVEFYDLQGQKVLYQVLPANVSSPFTQSIELSGLVSGVYVWRLAMPGGYERYEASGKIVISD